MRELSRLVAATAAFAAAAADDSTAPNGTPTSATGNADAASTQLEAAAPSTTWQQQARAQQGLYAGQWPAIDAAQNPAPGDAEERTNLVRAWLEGGALERLSSNGDSESDDGLERASKCKLAWPGSDPEDAICPGDFGTTIKCSMCLQKPENKLRLKLGNCTAEEQQQFCNPGPKLSAECSVALTDAFGPKHQGDPGHNPLDMYQGFSSWSMHLNEPGHYYQCNGLDGFHYWVDYMYQFTNPPWEPSPPAPHDDHEVQGAAEAGRGGGGQQQQHFLAVCIPDECSNEKDAQKITSDYAHYGLMHYWLAGGTTVEPKAPPLDTNAKIVIGFVFASAALCIVSTLLNSSWLTTCKAAMPMAENVSKRVRAQVAKCPHRADEIAAMCELDQWQFVLQMEAAEESGITPGGPGSIQGESTLQQTLLPKARPAGLERLNLQPAATRNGQTEDRGFCGKLLGCWDLGFNWRTGLMKQDGGVPEMRVLNGLRVLSMGWVVLCHGFLYQIMQANVQNKVYAQFDVGGRFLSALLPNGNFSVDTFFVLSGYLGAYVGMRKLNAMDRAGKKVPNVFVLAFNFLLERYLRLTPAYLFVLMFYMFVLPHIITGPHAITIEGKMAPDMNGIGGDFLYCQHYVWTNLLYISNLVPYHDHMFGTKYGDQFAGGQFGLHTAHGGLGCMGHSWFLSVDFQLHLLLPWLLVLFRWKPKPFYAVALAGIGANSAYLGFLVYEYHWSLGCHDRGFAGDTNTLYYGKPWCRISAWLVGVVLACYQSANSTRAGHLNPPGALLIAVGYVISGAVLFVCVFTPYWQQHHDESNPFADKSCGWSHTWDTIYSITCRTAWGCGIVFIIYAALTCQGGPLTRFLTWSFWTPFARLTYCWYLLHPLLMQVIYESNPAGENYYDLLGVAFYCFNVMIGLLCAATVFFLVELPAANLKNLVMPKVYAGIGYVITCGKTKKSKAAAAAAGDSPAASPAFVQGGLTVGSPSAVASPAATTPATTDYSQYYSTTAATTASAVSTGAKTD